MNFVVALLRTQSGQDIVMMVVDRLSKIRAHFVACHKTDDASHVIGFYFRDIIKPHGVPRTIVSD